MKKILYVRLQLLMVSILLITGCAIDVPNHPVVQEPGPVMIKPTTQLNSTPQEHVATPTHKCPRGKKGYRCRHHSQPQQHSTAQAISVPNVNYRFELGGTIEVQEISTTQDVITVRTVNSLQDKHAKVILSQGTTLKLLCNANSMATMENIGGNGFSVPVLLENEEHKPTGCTKALGAIKYLEITANTV